MRGRWIVVNPELSCIQGDMQANSAREAAAKLDAALSAHPGNETWAVYACPTGFPSNLDKYDGRSRDLIDALERSSRPAMFACAVPAEMRMVG